MRRTAPAAAALALVVAGCATGPSPRTGPSPALPAFPEVRGDLELYVAYPDSGDAIAVSDTNFIFGTTGTGAAELTIDGRPVEVNPNGSFLAWVPVPSRSAGDTARYRLVARAGDRADTLVHPVVLPPEPYAGEGRVWIDSASAGARPERWALPGEAVELEVRAAPGLRGWVEVAAAGGPGTPARPGAAPGDTTPDGGRAAAPRGRGLPLREVDDGRYRLRTTAAGLARAAREAARRKALRERLRRTHPGDAGPADSTGATRGTGGRSRRPGGPRPAAVPDAPGAGTDTLDLRFVVTDGRDTASARGRLPLRVLRPGRLPRAVLLEEPHEVHGRAGAVVGRPSPRGSYAWHFPEGTRAPVDGRRGDRLRLRLTPHLHAWVAEEDARVHPPGPAETPARGATATVGSISVEPAGDRLRIRVPVGGRLPASVSVAGPRTLALTVHGGLGGTERMDYGPTDPLLGSLAWEQRAGPRWRLEVGLTRPVWGWRLTWRGSALVLEVRRPPEIDGDDPLEGIRVAVDPGHPPVGAEGPTGLTEAAANLGVARTLERLLREAGAEPVLVREDTSSVGLYQRRNRAVAAGADLLVSIHNNALPDGLRPFERGGTSTYYFHPHARRLAHHVQRGMLESMGLRDLGVHWGNLALPREAWMPSVLTEGAFMMIPRHEAALRTEAFREAYARGVVEGLRSFLAERARASGDGG